MIRGTNAQFKFKLPYTKDELVWATIKFWQPQNPSKLLPITKKLQDCKAPADFKGLCVSLTAEETSRFLDTYKAVVQLRACHQGSVTVFGTRPQLITVYPMDDDIIEEDPIVPPLPGEDEDGVIILDGEDIVD